MTNTDQLRELIADVIRNKSHYGVAETPVLNGLMPLIEQHTATAVRAAGFPYAETYDFLYNNHKDVLEELEEHLDALKKEGSNE